ncbi:MAG: aspartyl protease family protein [Candidatus Pacebacteria bacterium]|nr:aspartyl protease family protein [Candidatus Paceibacterota bacterium]
MAVSKQPLGLNARNYLYIRPNNKRSAKVRADDKLLTKERLIQHKIPTPKLLTVFRSLHEVRVFDWTNVKNSFVLKPSRGYGGGGIILVRKWNGTSGRRSGTDIGVSELEAEIFSILDGAYSIDNLPDVAFLEERVVVAGSMRKFCKKGVPDIRVIVAHGVPIMAMLRLPTEHSDGKANLHQGALGVGIDLRTGITTKAVFYGKEVLYIPDTKIKVRGLKMPNWEKILEYAVQTQHASGLGYAGIDLVIDEEKGPMVLEVNARPGLQIQLANGASLRTRLERIEDMKIPSLEYGVELGKKLFAESALVEVPEVSNVLHVVERVTIIGPKGKKTVHAKVDTGAYRTALDSALVERLGLDLHHKEVQVRSGSGSHQTRKTVRVTFRLRGREVSTVASYNDRTHMRFSMIIGRRDLKGFLIDPTAHPTDLQ